MADQPLMLPVVIDPKPQVSISVQEADAEKMRAEFDKEIDKAYKATIATFCDSVFPSPTAGIAWRDKTSEFQILALEIAAKLARKYRTVPESVIQQHVEPRFQALTSFVFNKMRENGEKKSEE